MIKFKDACTNLELSKQLKDIGIKQKSLFYWISHTRNNKWYIVSDGCFNEHYHPEMVSAFISDELFDILPNRITLKENEPFNNFKFNMTRSVIVENDITKIDRTFIINYHCDTFESNNAFSFIENQLMKNIWDKSLSNSLAKTLIYLIENNLIEIRK